MISSFRNRAAGLSTRRFRRERANGARRSRHGAHFIQKGQLSWKGNGFGRVMYKKSAVFAFKSERLRLNGAPLCDCGTLHEGEDEIGECCLFFPPLKLGNGRHQKTVMSSRDLKRKKKEQYRYVAPNAYQAGYVAEFHDADQVALTRRVVADVCAGSQSATHAMEMMGVAGG